MFNGSLPRLRGIRELCFSTGLKQAMFLLQRLFLGLLLVLSAGVAQAAATGVIVAPVSRADLSDMIEALGTSAANESVAVTSKITEKIVSIHFEDGQRVKRGDLLVQLDDSEEQANLRSELAVLDERESALKRVQELFKRNVGSEADRDVALARVNQTRSVIEAIRTRIDAHRIRAPFDGVVGLRNISEGALVESNDVLTTLDDLSVIKVDFNIPVVFLSQVAPGLAIEARTSAYPDTAFKGELRSVAARIDPVTRTVQARAWFDNPGQKLRPGMLMQLDLQSRPRKALVVPESAVFAIGRSHYLYTVEQGEQPLARRHQVEIGTRYTGQVEILSGVSEGDQVIIHGTLKVADGRPVKIIAVDNGDLDIARVLKQNGMADSTP